MFVIEQAGFDVSMSFQDDGKSGAGTFHRLTKDDMETLIPKDSSLTFQNPSDV